MRCLLQVGFETEGTAIYDAMRHVRNEVCTSACTVDDLSELERVLSSNGCLLRVRSPFDHSKSRAALVIASTLWTDPHSGVWNCSGAGLHAPGGWPQGQALHAAAHNWCV